MKTVTEAAEFRKSVRQYTGADVPEADLREILRVAGLAPSPWNIQPWRVVVVRDPEVKEQLMAAAYGQPQVGAASAVFVIYSDMAEALTDPMEFVHPGFGEKREATAESIRQNFGKQTEEEREAWGYAESNIFLGYLLLACASHGYATSPMLGFEPDKVKSLLGLPGHVRLPALVAIGHGAEEGFSHYRHDVDRFARFV